MSRLADPRRILLIRPSALGDVCRSVPVLASLRARYPSAAIDWLVQDTFAPAIASHPALSGIVEFPRTQFKKWYSPSIAPQVRQYLSDLRSRQYDLVLDCQGLFRSGAFALATGAPRRIGYDNAPELAWLALTERVHAPRSLHAVDRMLMLAQAAGADPVYDLRLYTAPADRAFVHARPELSGGPFAVLAPTTRWPGKAWPPERFAELARALLEQRPFDIQRIAIVGSASERLQCGPLLDLASKDARVVDLLGATSVGQLLAVIEASQAVVGCDSAAIHMAVGFARPLAALFGPTRVERVGPFGRSANVVQRIIPGDVLNHKDEAAGQILMQRIQVQDVLDCLRLREAQTQQPAMPFGKAGC